MNVQVKELSQQDLDKLLNHTKGRIKTYVELKKPTSHRDIHKDLKLPLLFWQYRFVCLKCGEVHEMAPYAIAQTAMGNSLIYTCDCGHKTNLPQR